MRRWELHAYERPHAMHMQMVANFNRDPKKGKPYTMDQFYIYQPQEHKNLPKNKYGAAAMALVEQEMFPYWALFCYKQLAQSAAGQAPSLLCYKSETAILLAPEQTQDGMTGLLIAVEEASNQQQTLESPCGSKLVTVLPKIPTKILAKEGVTLPIIQLI